MATYGTNVNHANEDWKSSPAASVLAGSDPTITMNRPVTRPVAPQGQYRVTSGSDFAKPESNAPVLLGPESGIGWKTRLAKYKDDMETFRNSSSNAAALEREGISQAGQTGRQLSGEQAAIGLQGQRLASDATLQADRIAAASSLAGIQHKNELEKMTEADKYKSAEQNRTLGAQAILAGGNESVATNLINTAPGFQGNATGLNIPLKNTQLDQYQFITQDNGAGKGQTVLAGNKGSGVATPVNTPAAILAGGEDGKKANARQPQAQNSVNIPAQTPGQSGVMTPSAAAGQSANAYKDIYQSNPQRLIEDADAAHSQLGTVYKNNEDRFQYLRNLEKSNPQLHQELIRRLQAKQQQAAAL